jgi:hypothetical protein
MATEYNIPVSKLRSQHCDFHCALVPVGDFILYKYHGGRRPHLILDEASVAKIPRVIYEQDVYPEEWTDLISGVGLLPKEVVRETIVEQPRQRVFARPEPVVEEVVEVPAREFTREEVVERIPARTFTRGAPIVEEVVERIPARTFTRGGQRETTVITTPGGLQIEETEPVGGVQPTSYGISHPAQRQFYRQSELTGAPILVKEYL